MHSKCLRIKQPGQRAIWPRQSSTDPTTTYRAPDPDPLCLGSLLTISCRYGGGVVSQLLQVLLESVEWTLALPPARTEVHHVLPPHWVTALEHSPFHICHVPGSTMIFVSCRS